MGGSQNIGEASDNPVEINVTAMVDVIFCLCIFFMCSFHFKQLEGKIDAWLPTEKGNQVGPRPPTPVLEEIRIFLRWDGERQALIRKIANESVATDEVLTAAIRVRKDDFAKANRTDVPVIIDATETVPWQEVVHVLDLCRHEKLTPIEFAEPQQFRTRPEPR